MNNKGPPGIPELIPRGAQIININRGNGITVGRHSLPGSLGGNGGIMTVIGGNQIQQSNPPIRRPVTTTPGKLMRLRCRFRPLHDAYIKNGAIVEDDADVIFLCGDGHQLKAHKVIMASSSKFFAKIFEEQANQVAVVSVPDIKVDIMKLILHLTYRDRVILTMRQIKEVGEFITIFGMAWTQFGYEESGGDEPMSSLPMPPIPTKPVELPRSFLLDSPRSSPQQLRQIKPDPLGQGQVRKVYSGPGARLSLPLPQNVVKNGNDEEVHQQQQSDQQSQNERHSRKSRLTPRAGTEGEDIVEQDEEEDPENLIRDWMSKLGKREHPPTSTASGTSNAAAASPVAKRMRLEDEQNKPKNSCSVCQQKFNSETAWRWHEDRHVAHTMFKCMFCDEINNTPKSCWTHERDTHGFSGLKFYNANGAQNVPPKPQQKPQPAAATSVPQRTIVKPNPIIAAKFVGSPGQQLSKRIKLSTMKKVQAQQKKKPVNVTGTKLSEIGIGISNGSEQLDYKKLKQLHWLYVCERCDNCADSATKATLHFNRCFPGKEKKFEDTVTKYRQGFYGKSSCPLCPRRYPQNSGFMIHCGHQHQQYRKLFTHIGGTDDQIKCNNCKTKFAEPTGFHEHLVGKDISTYQCGKEEAEEPAQEPSPPTKPAPPARSSSEGKVTRPRPPRRPESPMESKASYKVQFHTPPKSARLASRALAEASAEASKANKGSDINFPPVDCPVCGDSDLPNISVHLITKHKDLNVDVTRISSELLRCKGCTITFDICDLLDHKNCLNPQQDGGGEKEETPASTSTGPQRRSSSITSVPAAKPTKSSPMVVDVDSLPPGVGRSPIEKIEINDLLSIQAIRSALKCLICGTTGKKLGAIADCLRSHGIHRCSLCFNSYCNKGDYALHLKKCHGSGSNKLKCPLCPKAFANAGQTSGHMYSTHWLQILKQNEQSLLEDAAAAKKAKEAEKEGKTATAAAEVVKSKKGEDTNMDQDEGDDDDDEDSKDTEDDENQTAVSGVLDPEQEEDDDDDDDEGRMEIDESATSENANEETSDMESTAQSSKNDKK